jgi:hypothetical protein
MPRMKAYDVPHKALRNALSQVSFLAGKTNFSDAGEVETLHHLGADVFKILSIHAADEDDVTLAELEKRCPGSSHHDMEDHKEIHVAQHKLENLFEEIYSDSKSGKDVGEKGAEFYLAWSEFHSAYLKHTSEEERVTQPLLWKHFTDDELIGLRGKIMAKNPPETLLIWIKFVAPAQTHQERVGLLSGFKKMAPPVFFNQVMAVIKTVLAPNDFSVLNEALGN